MDWFASNWGLLVLAACVVILVAVFSRRGGRTPKD